MIYNRLSALSVIILIALFLHSCASQSSPKPGSQAIVGNSSKGYQITYLIPMGNVSMKQQQYNDGEGHLRVELLGANSQMISIYDLPAKQVISWREDGNKEYSKRPLRDEEQALFDPKASPSMAKAEPIGEKEVDGRKCHGWRYVSPQGLVTESWIDDQFNCLIKSTTGGTTIELDSFAATQPDPSLFQPPAGYNEVKPSTKNEPGTPR